jgi:hypothetical protein
MKGGQVAHSAELVDDEYNQTLPGGPVFSTELALLQKLYRPVYLLP